VFREPSAGERKPTADWSSSDVKSATAVAHANIALAKYWGKSDVGKNLPAVPSLSMTLAALSTRTKVSFVPGLEADTLSINDQPRRGRELERVSSALDKVRAEANFTGFARVESRNDFPTAAGLASSASGFAALALAARAALDLTPSLERVSALARSASASAARSAYGGYVILRRDAESAEPFLKAEDFPLTMLVAIVSQETKSISSTEAMLHTARTSSYYAAWLEAAPHLFERIQRALRDRDLNALGAAVEHSAMAMHASMLAADPAVLYFKAGSLAAMSLIQKLRAQGASAFFTMDAGPNVKVITLPEQASEVAAELRSLPEIEDVMISSIGPDAHLIDP
jgi:diphosphomevalonate decarboxylase